MSNRHLARTIALQALYQWDFNGKKNKDLSGIIKYDKQEFAPDFSDGGFIDATVEGVTSNLETIDSYIIKYAPEWPIDKIIFIDRNVLRIGLFELLYNNDIPAKVAINEAIDLAKAFGGESSGKFVNGVLGTIYAEQKEAIEKNKIKQENDEK
jgi:N utilization substance protein B